MERHNSENTVFPMIIVMLIMNVVVLVVILENYVLRFSFARLGLGGPFGIPYLKVCSQHVQRFIVNHLPNLNAEATLQR